MDRHEVIDGTCAAEVDCSTETLSWLAILLLLNQYPALPVSAPKLDVAHTKSSPLKDTTMTRIIKLAIIVEMPFRDLRFLFALDLADLTVDTFSIPL